MHRLALILSLLVFVASTSFAAQTYTVPFSIVPGSVYYLPPFGADPVPASIPLTLPVAITPAQDNDCAAATGTFTVDLVNGTLDVGLDGVVVSGTGGQCLLGGRLALDIEVDVPELNGTSTEIYAKPSPQTNSFSEIDRVVYSFKADAVDATRANRAKSTTLGPELDFVPGIESSLLWGSGTGPTFKPISTQSWLPGDKLIIPVIVELYFDATSQDTIGEVRVRQELKVTVPEPSAALTLPMGALTIFGLSSRRG